MKLDWMSSITFQLMRHLINNSASFLMHPIHPAIIKSGFIKQMNSNWLTEINWNEFGLIQEIRI